MPSIAQTIHAPAGERIGATVSQLFARLAHSLRRRRTYMRTLNELRALSDRELADLGMHRAGLKAIAAEAADRTAV